MCLLHFVYEKISFSSSQSSSQLSQIYVFRRCGALASFYWSTLALPLYIILTVSLIALWVWVCSSYKTVYGAFDYFSFWVYRRLPSKSVRLSFKWKFSIRMMDNPAKFVSHSNMHSWLLPIAWRQDSTLKKACFFITLDNNRQS